MRRTKKPHIILMLALIFSFISVFNPAITESQTWDCPECGRTGNTRNYCGGCGHPAPWIVDPEQDTKVSVGDIVKFGHYEQDNNPDNGPEKIEWIVLDVKNGKALLISRYVLDNRKYGNNWKYINWEESSIRNWLNNSFFQTAFSKEESTAIIPTDTDNDPLQDRVFILSGKEVFSFFTDREARKCLPTEYAISQGDTTQTKQRAEGRATTHWWLRGTDGSYKGSAGFVEYDGRVIYDDVSRAYGIRPAIWVDLDSQVISEEKNETTSLNNSD